MKSLLFLIIFGAMALLWIDDNAKRTDLIKAEGRIDAAQQQARTELALVQQLTTERNQLVQQIMRSGGTPQTVVMSGSGSGPVAVVAPTPIPTPTPTWFQQRLNGIGGSALDSPTPPAPSDPARP
jgi:hypothetical protein